MNHFDIRNYLEEGVSSYLDEAILRDPSFCRCEKCRLDAMALALNELKPKYVVTDKGYTITKTMELDAQFRADVTFAVVKAMKKVKRTPKH